MSHRMGLFDPNSDSFHVGPAHQALVREMGIDARGVFTDPRIVAWRKLNDRQNCTLDEAVGGQRVRLHVKRYTAVPGPTPADDEQAGHRLLLDAGIATAPLVAWGVLTDRRSFTIWQDLTGFTPGDKLIESGIPFERILAPTADLAAKLHQAGLHHRDLYLCHFMVALAGDTVELRLIDTARVRQLPSLFLRRRWIVKDLAQFWYSTTKHAISEEQRERWLAIYANRRGVSPRSLRSAIRRKSNAIARHDRRLNEKQPTRNVSIG